MTRRVTSGLSIGSRQVGGQALYRHTERTGEALSSYLARRFAPVRLDVLHEEAVDAPGVRESLLRDGGAPLLLQRLPGEVDPKGQIGLPAGLVGGLPAHVADAT